MNKKLERAWEELEKKYSQEQLAHFKEDYNEACDLYASGSEVEDKQGLEIAQMEYYQDADNLMAELPEDYKEYRELLNEIY